MLQKQLQRLIEACKRTGDFQPVAKLGLSLISNKVNELGIKLGFPARNGEGISISVHARKLNDAVEQAGFGFKLIPATCVDKLYLIERYLEHANGNISLKTIKDMLEVYYELKKITVPAFHETQPNTNPSLQLFSSMSSPKGSKIDGYKTLLLGKLKEKEMRLQNKLCSGYDPETFQESMMVKRLMKSVKSNSSKQDSFISMFQNSLKKGGITGYYLIAAFILFLGLGIVTAYQCSLYPFLTEALNTIYFLFFAGAGLMVLGYWYLFIKKY